MTSKLLMKQWFLCIKEGGRENRREEKDPQSYRDSKSLGCLRAVLFSITTNFLTLRRSKNRTEPKRDERNQVEIKWNKITNRNKSVQSDTSRDPGSAGTPFALLIAQSRLRISFKRIVVLVGRYDEEIGKMAKKSQKRRKRRTDWMMIHRLVRRGNLYISRARKQAHCKYVVDTRENPKQNRKKMQNDEKIPEKKSVS